MRLTHRYSSIFRFFYCGIITISLGACTQDIHTQEQSKNFGTPIPHDGVIRVIIDRSIINIDPFLNYNWNYMTQAKIKSEDFFLHLGYSTIDTGLAPANKGKPTLIAVVNARQDPLKKDSINYSITLYKPLSFDNSLLNCDQEQQSHNICISPQKIINAQQLFTANCTYSGSANVASFVMNYCVKSAFTTYPNGSNKRIIYTTKEQPLIENLDKR